MFHFELRSSFRIYDEIVRLTANVLSLKEYAFPFLSLGNTPHNESLDGHVGDMTNVEKLQRASAPTLCDLSII